MPSRSIMLLVLAFWTLCGCRNTDPFEREQLSGPLMQLDMDPGEVHFLQKAGFSREGSVGGLGKVAGGGCGCY